MGMMREFSNKKNKEQRDSEIVLQAAMQAIAGLSEQVTALSEQLASVQNTAEGGETK